MAHNETRSKRLRVACACVALLIGLSMVAVATGSEASALDANPGEGFADYAFGVFVLRLENAHNEIEVWDESILEHLSPQSTRNLDGVESHEPLSEQVVDVTTEIDEGIQGQDLAETTDELDAALAALPAAVALGLREEIQTADGLLDELRDKEALFLSLRRSLNTKIVQLAAEVESNTLTVRQAQGELRKWRTEVFDPVLPSLRQALEDRAFRVGNALQRVHDLAKDEPNVEEWIPALEKLAKKGRFVTARYRNIAKAIGKLTALAVLADTIFYAHSVAASEFGLYNHQLFIRWRVGSPVKAVKPCRNEVRTGSGQIIPNTISCPLEDDPFSVFKVARIFGGNQRDVIDLHLTPEHNRLDAVYVDAGEGADEIRGSFLGDILEGGPGNDTIKGRGGDDKIWGATSSWFGNPLEDDNDRLFGDAGEDMVFGQGGHDMVLGGDGDDTATIRRALQGGQGNDVLVGGEGADEMDGGPGRDTVFARESEFLRDPEKPEAGFEEDEFDVRVDCGGGDDGEEYATTSPGIDSLGFILEPTRNCDHLPRQPEAAATLLDQTPSPDGSWPWFFDAP